MASDNDKNIGLKLGNYVLREKLGSGGMASVYLAEHPEIGRQVAVKILSLAMVERPSLCERFLTEAKTLARLRHPRIIEIYDYGRLESEQPYYVMEYLQGQEFGDRMKAAGQLPLNDLLPIFEQLCQGLQAAHDAGVVHRDLKPPNIFIQEGKELSVKLLDFGIAKILDQSVDDSELTQTGMVLGSPVTIAPEQVQGEKKNVGRATDIYALGVILHWAIAGRPPFYGARAPIIMAMHVQEPAPRLDTIVDGLPTSLVDVVARCLQKKPADRFQSPAELFAALEEATHDLSNQETIFPRTDSRVSAAANSNTPTASPTDRDPSTAETQHATGLEVVAENSNEDVGLKGITTTLGSAIGEISAITGPQKQSPRWMLPLSVGAIAAAVAMVFFFAGADQQATPDAPNSSNTNVAAKGKSGKSQAPPTSPTNILLNVEIAPTPADTRCEVSLDGQSLKEQKAPCKYRFRKGAAVVFTLHAEGHASKTIKWQADAAQTFTPKLEKQPESPLVAESATQDKATPKPATATKRKALSRRSKRSAKTKRSNRQKRTSEPSLAKEKKKEPAKAKATPKYKIRDGTMGI
jgi:serine/threonine protein kinase